MHLAASLPLIDDLDYTHRHRRAARSGVAEPGWWGALYMLAEVAEELKTSS